MSVPTHPTGYDETKDVPVTRRFDCHMTVGFDRHRTHIPRFVVHLHYTPSSVPFQWRSIARFDHNETGDEGHDIYSEGVHIDVSRESGGEWTIEPQECALPQNRGKVIRWCVEYFDREADYFVDVYTGDISPANPPSWPDGGLPPGELISPKRIVGRMRPEPRGEETVSKEELSEILADATGTTAAEIERGAEELDIGPPWEAEVVEHPDESDD